MKLAGTNLLLLEDEPLRWRRITARLEKLDVAVTLAGTIAETRQALRHLDFDFALLDVNLPDDRSIELLEDKSIPASVVAIAQ